MSRPTSRRAGPPAACSASSARAPDELRALVEVHEPAEAELEGGVLLLGRDRVAGARVLGLDQDQAGLDARDVHRADPDRVDPVVLAHVEDPVPHGERAVGGHPQLVAAVARVAGARDVDRRRRRSRTRRRRKYFTSAQSWPVAASSTSRESWPWSARPAVSSLMSFDLDVEVGAGHQEPAVAGVGGGDPVGRVRQARHRAVVDDLALLVAPGRVVDLVDLELRDVARHHAVQQARGVLPGDLVLVEGAHVDHGRGLADRVVLDVVEVRVHGGRVVARPTRPRPASCSAPAHAGRTRCRRSTVDLLVTVDAAGHAAPPVRKPSPRPRRPTRAR